MDVVNNALKNFYLDVVAEHLNTSHPFLTAIEHTSRDVWGKNIIKLIHWNGDWVQLELELANLYGTIELSKKAMRASVNHASAFVNLLNSEIEDMIKRMKNNMSTQLFYCGGMTGFSDIFRRDGKIYGLNRAEYPQLVPYIKEDFSELTEGKFFDVIDRFEETPDFIITTREIAQHIKRIGYSDVIDLYSGHKAMNWHGIAVIADLKCPKDTMYILNSKDFSMHQLCDWQWLEGEDELVLKKCNYKPIYTSTLVKYANLMCSNPSNQAMLIGVMVKGE